MLQHKKDLPRGKFKTPYMNGKWPVPGMLLLAVLWMFQYQREDTVSFLLNTPQQISNQDFIGGLDKAEIDLVRSYVMQHDSTGLLLAESDLDAYVAGMTGPEYQTMLNTLPVNETKKTITGWSLFRHKIPMWIFMLVSVTLSVLTFIRNLSLIPVLGVLSCLYMMAQIQLQNWIGFAIWLVIGLLIYFGYSYPHSRLGRKEPGL